MRIDGLGNIPQPMEIPPPSLQQAQNAAQDANAQLMSLGSDLTTCTAIATDLRTVSQYLLSLPNLYQTNNVVLNFLSHLIDCLPLHTETSASGANGLEAFAGSSSPPLTIAELASSLQSYLQQYSSQSLESHTGLGYLTSTLGTFGYGVPPDTSKGSYDYTSMLQTLFSNFPTPTSWSALNTQDPFFANVFITILQKYSDEHPTDQYASTLLGMLPPNAPSNDFPNAWANLQQELCGT